jgi:hypothetical protein
MKTPKFTDADKHIRPYADADATDRPGYLRDKFSRIRRELRERDEAEAAKPRAVVKPIRKEQK